MAIEIQIQISAPELAEAVGRLADAMKCSALVKMKTAAAELENGEIVIPAGTPMTVTEVKQEPEKPKPRRKASAKQAQAEAPETPAEKPQESAEAPQTTQAETVPAPQEAPAETPWETVAEHPAAADIAAEASGVPTLEAIANAGAQLLDKGPEKMNELISLLREFDVQAITQLRPEQLGEFAERLRALGAEV